MKDNHTTLRPEAVAYTHSSSCHLRRWAGGALSSPGQTSQPAGAEGLP
jgi:hypothetical protein